MLARSLCVYNAGLKVNASQELFTVVMTSYYKIICLCKRQHGSSSRFDLLCAFLVSRLITLSFVIMAIGSFYKAVLVSEINAVTFYLCISCCVDYLGIGSLRVNVLVVPFHQYQHGD